MKRYDREAIEPNAAFFKALGHPTRLWIVEQLADGEHCVCEPPTAPCKCSCAGKGCAASVRLTFRERLSFAVAETRDIFKRIWLWVLVGIALGAGLHGYVPDGFIASHLGGEQWWTVPLAVVIGIPTYADVTSVIPITGELINKGLPVGTAFAFMLSTEAASVPEFIMLKKVMTGKLLALFAAYLFAYFVLCGWTLNLFY